MLHQGERRGGEGGQAGAGLPLLPLLPCRRRRSRCRRSSVPVLFMAN